jgi:hypothetical protein
VIAALGVISTRLSSSAQKAMPKPSRTLALTAALGIVALATAIVLNFQYKPTVSGAGANPPVSPAADAKSLASGNPDTNRERSVIEAGALNHDPAKAPQTPPIATANPGNPAAASTPRSDYQPPPSKYKNARNPIARRALAGVGTDPESERVWLEAINDPNLPADERKDLIEDLNEDGLSNPAKPGQRDLPLIKSRLLLLEQLIPSAMDQTNAAAFQEAQKDLVNMVDRLGR